MFFFRLTPFAALLAATTNCSVVLQTAGEQCAATTDCAALAKTDSAFSGTVCQAHVCVVPEKPKQCTVDADCTALAETDASFAGTVCKTATNVCVSAPDPKWSCVGHVVEEPATQQDVITVRLLNVIGGAPASGLTVKLCSKIDPECTSPLGAPAVAADGSVTVTLAARDDAYLDVQSTAFMPSLVVLDHVAWSKENDILLVPKGAFSGIATGADIVFDPTKGVILVRLVDCQNQPTAGATMVVQPPAEGTPFFLINNSATRAATESDSAGNGGIGNVTPGVATVTTSIAATGTVYGNVATPVRANTCTFQALRPTSGL